jgi:hypothetical protein
VTGTGLPAEGDRRCHARHPVPERSAVWLVPDATGAAPTPSNLLLYQGDWSMNKRVYTVAAVALLLLLPLTMAFAAGGGERHPRIHKAIGAIGAAIDELKAAPHDFGGHREAAVDACQKAVEQLKLALQYDRK